MKLICMFLLIFLTEGLYGSTGFTENVRSLYKASAANKDSCMKLIGLLTHFDEENNSLMAGYRACATMMMAGHVINPFSKFSYFRKGRELLEKCIQNDSDNIELRFLRFSVQTNLPGFLNYNRSIKEDKQVLLDTILQVPDVKLKKFIINFLRNSAYLTRAEKQKIGNN